MMAVTNQFRIGVGQLIHGTNHAQLPVGQAPHTVIGVNPDTGTCFDRSFGFIIGCVRMPQSNGHTFISQRADKLIHAITLWRESNLIEQAICSLLPSTKLIHVRIFHIGRILSTFILLGEVRPFKIETANLGPAGFLIASTDIFSNRQKPLIGRCQGCW